MFSVSSTVVLVILWIAPVSNSGLSWWGILVISLLRYLILNYLIEEITTLRFMAESLLALSFGLEQVFSFTSTRAISFAATKTEE